MHPGKLSIIIPVYNEERTVVAVLEKVFEVELPIGITKEVVIINDASKDNSRSEIENYILQRGNRDDLIFINHEVNLGKGGSVHTALRNISGDYFIIQDADLELDPNDFVKILKPVLENRADVVFGSRFLNTKPDGVNWSLSYFANSFLTSFSNFAFGTKLTDMETCYKLIPAFVMKDIFLEEERFGFEPEITAKLSRQKKLRITEVAVSYQARKNWQGKKIGWKDGFRAIFCIVKYGILKK